MRMSGQGIYIGSETTNLSDQELQEHLSTFLTSLGDREDVLLLPPDYTRFHSQAGKITRLICEHYGFVVPPAKESSEGTPSATKKAKVDDEDKTPPPNIDILPALGTHAPMSETEIHKMYGDALADKNPFHVHDWRKDVVTIGQVPASMVKKATHGMVEEPWPAQLNRMVWNKRLHDPAKQKHKSLVLSIGQVVPHEVMGMANFNKNLFVGTGGVEAINLSHFIGAVHGMERMMGRKSNPLRDILNYASEHFLEKELDLWYILTVVGTDHTSGDLCIRGLYIGRDIDCYSKACDLSLKVNFNLLDKPFGRCIVYLDPDEFHSTWLGNKAIYRTRMAMADEGELIILAPGVSRFGEDDHIDQLIRKYGYKGTPSIMESMKENQELKDNLSAVAHLIHGSTEGRFHVTYCTQPENLSKAEVEQVGFQHENYSEAAQKYSVSELKDGWQTDADGDFYFISNPALGLWSLAARFAEGN